MNLSTVKSIAIPEGNATSFSIGGVKVWGGGSSGDEPAELLSWEGVAYHINKGTYKDVYAIGDMVPLDLGSEGLINMQIAAFDTDKLADGSGTAAITWVAKELLNTGVQMNPKREGSVGNYVEGTGSVGGWEKCEARAHLNNTIVPLVPSIVMESVVLISKTQKAATTGGLYRDQTTDERLWIPAKSEVESGIYNKIYNGTTSRVKTKPGASSAEVWWLRDTTSTEHFNAAGTSGKISTYYVYNPKAICLGFCTGRTPT